MRLRTIACWSVFLALSPLWTFKSENVGVAAPVVTAPPPAIAVGSVAQPGVYAGPDWKGIKGLAAFDLATGQKSTEILDFESASSWSQIEGQSWLLKPHSGQKQTLELSVPMLPSLGEVSLSACAAGAYNSHWAALASNLVSYNLSSAIVRPGWEANGNWYKWSALGHAKAYAGCFRQVVNVMRGVPGARFSFDWTVSDNINFDQAVKAWPGSRYVTYVGVDAYDTSWTNYEGRVQVAQSDQVATADYLINGVGGLREWSQFAKDKHVRFAIPEWGLSWRSDGHGGGNDPVYLSDMFEIFEGRLHLPTSVAYEHYFDESSVSEDHRLTGNARFATSLGWYRADAAVMSRLSTTAASRGRGTRNRRK